MFIILTEIPLPLRSISSLRPIPPTSYASLGSIFFHFHHLQNFSGSSNLSAPQVRSLWKAWGEWRRRDCGKCSSFPLFFFPLDRSINQPNLPPSLSSLHDQIQNGIYMQLYGTYNFYNVLFPQCVCHNFLRLIRKISEINAYDIIDFF